MTNLQFRQATAQDLPALVAMLADDKLGQQRENATLPLQESYYQAFNAIDVDPNNELIVVEQGDKLVGMLQLTFIPYLTYQGSRRCLIEGVRTHSDFRGQGIGTQLLTWIINYARQKECRILQLTSDKQRPQALHFYESLGFTATHEGFKMHLK